MGYMKKNCIDVSMPKVEAGTSLTMAVSKRLSIWTARNVPVDAEEMEIVWKKAL